MTIATRDSSYLRLRHHSSSSNFFSYRKYYSSKPTMLLGISSQSELCMHITQMILDGILKDLERKKISSNLLGILKHFQELVVLL